MTITPLRRAALAALTVGCFASAAPAPAESGAGAYLAARSAATHNDYASAATYFARALFRDAGNAQLMERLAATHVAAGHFDRALPVAEQMHDSGLESQIANLVRLAGMAAGEDFSAVLARDPSKDGVGPLVDGLAMAWAQMGEGSVSKALQTFDIVSEQKGLHGFALYHKAMALAMAGDFEGAEELFADPESGAAMMTRRGAMARAEILSQLGRNDDALQMLSDAFGDRFDPGLERMSALLEAGETMPFTHVRSARDGMAEVYFSVASALNGEAKDDYTLVYARAAQYLRPGHTDAQLLAAELLDQLGQYELAAQSYKMVPPDSPDHHAAELGRAKTLRRAGKLDAAIEVLERLADTYPDLAIVHSSLGDLMRREQDYASAVEAYDRALALTPDGAASRWFLFYVRGIAHERLGDWPAAEADFRAALDLNPDQPQVLNYLGYSMVEHRVNFDEALGMIERAVAARPESGHIVDSLGWVLFQLGRSEEAVGHLERAVELMPVDPVVNDHLGDAYWSVGRYREARFQWSRSLSLVASGDDAEGEADAGRIRRKLEVGLAEVLKEEERAGQVELANDGG